MTGLIKKKTAPAVQEAEPEPEPQDPATLPDEQDVSTVRARRKPRKRALSAEGTRRVAPQQEGREYSRGTLG